MPLVCCKPTAIRKWLKKRQRRLLLASVFSRKSCFHLRVTALAQLEAAFICQLDRATLAVRSRGYQWRRNRLSPWQSPSSPPLSTCDLTPSQGISPDWILRPSAETDLLSSRTASAEAGRSYGR